MDAKRRLDSGVLDDLNPVSVRVHDEGYRLELSVRKPLLELHLLGFKKLACGSDVVRGKRYGIILRIVFYSREHGESLTKMSEALGLRIAVMVHLSLPLFGSLDPDELKKAFALK